MTIDERKAALLAMPWAQALDLSIVHWLAQSVREVTFRPGDVLIRQGDLQRDCYFLIRGTVEVAIDGRVVGRSGPGEPEGEMSLFYRRPRGATATAVDAIEALCLPAADFDELVEHDARSARSLADAILDHLSERFGYRLPAWQPPN